MKKKEGRLNLRIDQDLLARVRKVAERQNLTVTALVEMSFRTFLTSVEEDKKRRRSPVEAEQI